MKTLTILIAAQLITLSALAEPVMTASRSSNNGSVAPQYQTSTTCDITAGIVKIVQKGAGIQFPRPLLKQATFTTDVPNEAVMASLIADAARAPVVSKPGPIGGGTVTYEVTIDGNGTYLHQTEGGSVTQENNSAAAKKLEIFLDQNC